MPQPPAAGTEESATSARRLPPGISGPGGSLLPVEKHIHIEPPWVGLTVLEAVRRAFSEVTPREVFRKARIGEIRVQDAPCHPLRTLVRGDRLTVVLLRPKTPPAARVLRENEEVDTPAGPFGILREDDDLLAVAKPAGCASHPALRRGGDTLIERVRHHLGVSPGHLFQPALANRLDVGTSGIVLVGKTARAQSRLGRHMQRGAIRKLYLALVGGWPQPAGEIRAPLLRHPDSRDLARLRRTGHPLPGVKLQEALTRYRVLERLGPPVACALLEVELLTGRTHQIRRHLSQIGHPVAGDNRYGDPELNRAVGSVAGLTRTFLHAHRVLFRHPTTGEELDLSAAIPSDLAACVTALRFPASLISS